MKNAFCSILVIILIATNLYLVFEVKSLKKDQANAIDETVKKVRAEFDAALSPKAMTARLGDEAGKSMESFQKSLVTNYEQLRAQAEKTAKDLRAAAEPMIQEMKAKASEMGQTIGSSTQQLGEAVEQQAKDLNKTTQ